MAGGVFLRVGEDVNVGKFFEVIFNGARVAERITNVINIFLACDGPVTGTPIFDMVRLAYITIGSFHATVTRSCSRPLRISSYLAKMLCLMV